MEEILCEKRRREYTLFRLSGIAAVVFLIMSNIVGATPFAYITNYADNTTSVIDTATNTVVSTINVESGPYGTAVSPDGKKVYVANFGSNNISVINTSTYNNTASIDVGNSPVGVAVSPDGTRVYVSNLDDNTTSVIDATTNTVITTVPVGEYPAGVAVSPDGSKVYVTNSVYMENETYNSTVFIIDTSKNTVIDNVVVGEGPIDVVFTSDGSKVYVTNGEDNTISVINTTDNTVIATIPVGNDPRGITVTPDGSKVYVANSDLSENLTYKNGTVSVINTSTNTVIDTVPVGVTPHGVSVTPDGSKVYVTNAYDGTVSVINTTTDKVITSIPVGVWPITIGQFIGGQEDTGNNSETSDNATDMASTEPVLITKSNGEFNNTLSITGTVTRITSKPVNLGYEIKFNILNNGDDPFIFNTAQIIVLNGNDTKAYVETNTILFYTTKDKETLDFVKIKRGENYTETFHTFGNEKAVIQGSVTGKLAAHITFFMGDNVTSENAVAAFHAIIPRPEDMVDDKEYPLEFTDFMTAQKAANPNFHFS